MLVWFGICVFYCLVGEVCDLVVDGVYCCLVWEYFFGKYVVYFCVVVQVVVGEYGEVVVEVGGQVYG